MSKHRPGQIIRTINIAFTQTLVETVDQHAQALYASRSEYIRHAVIEQIRIDSQNADVRKTMAKQLPNKYIEKGKTDEFEISDDYML